MAERTALDAFFADLRQAGTTSRARTAELADAYAKGRTTAQRNALVKANLSLVVAVARPFRHVADLGDLIQEGTLGLFKAADLYNPAEHSAAFSTYAYQWVRKRVYAAVRAAGAARRTEHADRMMRAEEQAHDRLAQQLGREPTETEVNSALGRAKATSAGQAARLLRENLGDEALAQVPSAADVEDEVDRHLRIERLLHMLDEVAPPGTRSRVLFDAYALAGRRLVDVAKELRLSKERAAAMYASIWKQLRQRAVEQHEPRAEREDQQITLFAT